MLLNVSTCASRPIQGGASPRDHLQSQTASCFLLATTAEMAFSFGSTLPAFGAVARRDYLLSARGEWFAHHPALRSNSVRLMCSGPNEIGTTSTHRAVHNIKAFEIVLYRNHDIYSNYGVYATKEEAVRKFVETANEYVQSTATYVDETKLSFSYHEDSGATNR